LLELPLKGKEKKKDEKDRVEIATLFLAVMLLTLT
jgi:hypothetical protein